MLRPVVRVGTIKILLIDQLANIYYLVQLAMSVYFVDHVLYGHAVDSAALADGRAEPAPFDLRTTELAVMLGLLHALPCFPLNMLQEVKCWFGVGGAARKTIQVALLRQYLDYTDASRKRIGHTGFMQAILRDSHEVIDNGYFKILESVRSAAKIVALIMWTGLSIPLGIPLMMAPLVVMACRLRSVERSALTLRLKYFKAQANMLDHAHDVISNFSLCVQPHPLSLASTLALLPRVAPPHGERCPCAHWPTAHVALTRWTPHSSPSTGGWPFARRLTFLARLPLGRAGCVTTNDGL